MPCSAWPTGVAAGSSPRGLHAGGWPEDGPLPGATANRGLVVRVGGTVLRPTAPCRRATHALLAHLAAVGFDGAPRVLAVGPSTEMLTYIDGQAAVPPLAGDMLTDAALVSVADLLRRYHAAASSFDPAGYRWPRPIPAIRASPTTGARWRRRPPGRGAGASATSATCWPRRDNLPTERS